MNVSTDSAQRLSAQADTRLTVCTVCTVCTDWGASLRQAATSSDLTITFWLE